MLFLLISFFVGVGLFVYLLVSAPWGYEDEDGFHLGYQPDKNETQKDRKNQFNQPF
jgi:hypothetical protein